MNTYYFYSPTNDDRDVKRALDFQVNALQFALDFSFSWNLVDNYYLQLGWLADPIFSRNGDYPAVMREQIDSSSTREGLRSSRLPTFSDFWIEQIRGSADFFGLNYYSSRYVELLNEPVGLNPSYFRDTMLNATVKPEWKQSVTTHIYSVPSGLGDLLR